jgi:hypothetical protein
MKKETLKRDKQDTIYSEAVKFIAKLLDANIPLDVINTNDFHSNSRPSVYIGVGYMGERYMKRCQRYSNYDVKNAVRWYFVRYPIEA